MFIVKIPSGSQEWQSFSKGRNETFMQLRHEYMDGGLVTSSL